MYSEEAGECHVLSRWSSGPCSLRTPGVAPAHQSNCWAGAWLMAWLSFCLLLHLHWHPRAHESLTWTVPDARAAAPRWSRAQVPIRSGRAAVSVPEAEAQRRPPPWARASGTHQPSTALGAGLMSGLREKLHPQPMTPLVTLPLTRMEFPEGANIGGSYYLLPFVVEGKGPYYFAVDTGLTGTIVLPEVADAIGLQNAGGSVTGLGSGGELQARVGRVEDLRLAGDVQVGPINIAVVPFFHEAANKLQYPVGGMVGQAFLMEYDVCFDPEKQEVSHHRAARTPFTGPKVSVYRAPQGIKAAVARTPPLQAILLPNYLMGLRVTASVPDTFVPALDLLPDAFRAALGNRTAQLAALPGTGAVAGPEVLLGVLDTGATYSIMNWAAARSLGIAPDDPRLALCPSVYLRGMDGRMVTTPLVQLRLTLCSFAHAPVPRYSAAPPGWAFGGMEAEGGDTCVAFSRVVLVGVSDMNFEGLLQIPGKGAYTGPAVLVGQNVLQQQPVVLSSATRKLAFVNPRA